MTTFIRFLTQAEARARLSSMLAADKYPVLSSAQLDDLMLMSRTLDFYGVWADAYQPWQASHAYALGGQLVPTTRNGHFYEVTVAGAGAAGEPVWPTTSAGLVVSGAATFREAGLAPWLGAWNLNIAASEGWRWKAGMVAAEFDFHSDVSGFTRSQMHKAFLELADLYDKGVFSTIQVGGYLYDPVIGNLNAGV